MRDPHVVLLHYRLAPAEAVTFSESAVPIEAEADGFKVRLSEGALTVEMREHHPSEQSAREAVEPFLRAWEIRHALEGGGGRPEFQFEFERAEVIDRDPPPPPKPGEPQTIELEGIVHGRAVLGATLSVTRGSYPAPPTAFVLDPDVETLWQRWEGYLAGREPLQPMAYFCLTVLEIRGGGRRGAASRFAISPKVLATIARLSTERGDRATARKATGSMQPLSDRERAWLEAAVKTITRRAGEVAANPGAPLPQLTMADLPRL